MEIKKPEILVNISAHGARRDTVEERIMRKDKKGNGSATKKGLLLWSLGYQWMVKKLGIKHYGFLELL